MKRSTIALAGLVAMLGSVIALWIAIQAPAKAAARHVAAINGLSVGKTTEAELLVRPEFQTAHRSCVQETCFYHMEAENTWLRRLGLAPRTSIETMVVVHEAMVAEVDLLSLREGSPMVSIHQLDTLPKECRVSPCVKPRSNPLAGISIWLDNQTDLRNHLPQAINPECLSRVHGCSSYAEFMPLTKELKIEVPETH